MVYSFLIDCWVNEINMVNTRLGEKSVDSNYQHLSCGFPNFVGCNHAFMAIETSLDAFSCFRGLLNLWLFYFVFCYEE